MIWSEKGHFGPCLACLSYQCQGVPKLCAKFGRSRIPRTTNIHKSIFTVFVIVKEASPFLWVKIIVSGEKNPIMGGTRLLLACKAKLSIIYERAGSNSHIR